MRSTLYTVITSLALVACVDGVDSPDGDPIAIDRLAPIGLEPHAFEPDPFAIPVAGIDLDGDGYDSNDCDDTDAAIHPFTKELDNGVDDNCENGVDEPMLAYATTRPSEAQTYAQVPPLKLRITDAATIAYLNANPTVKFHLTYQRLSAGSTADVVTAQQSMAVTPFGNWLSIYLIPAARWTRTLTIDPNSANRGLQARQIYRMKVQLHDANGADLGPSTGWFFVPTAGTSTSPNTTLQWGRIDVALQSLDQYGDSEDGLIGKGGTVAPDGQRFTASNLVPLHANYHPGDDLGWCDWFVHYVGAVVTDGLDGSYASNVVVDGGNTFWHDMNPNMVPNAFRDPVGDGCGTEIGDPDGDGVVGEVIANGCQNYAAGTVALDTNDNEFFSNIPGNLYYDATKSLPGNQGIGNYQAMDHHAGTFLAFDAAGDGSFSGAGATGTVWSIEGNVSNHVRVMHRPANSTVINGFGKLTLSMFQ